MRAEPLYTFDWVNTADELANVAGILASEPVISVDTETSGWQTGNEQLCLIQIGVPSSRHVYLVDVLSTGAPESLAAVMNAATPLVVAHNASFEERQFARYGIKVKGVRDTLTMARELRPDLPNHTLRTCCKLLLGVELSKEEQVSDWSMRPLTDSQVAYARLDAEVALTLYDYLAELEGRVVQELDLAIPELMREYSLISRKRYELTSTIAHEIAFLTAREAKIKETIRQKLIDGDSPYDGPFGTCAVSKVKRTEVNCERVRQLFPEFASEVIKEYVDRKRFDSVAAERGLPKNTIDSVLDVVGYNERLSLALYDETGSKE
jgi:DNA polymerase III epsilon subunit-like protein